ncbi:hypothetical protein [Bradyrhizobium sp. 174]|uniref:ParB/RepB/Spo0J family partition protein n=1 Tax=Bradyrhizobium sp. 174 TaxID=2782645 RepID=UPI0031F6E44E|nr:hypothetical protein [Bradyrhizobium sp. 174]
MTRMATKAHKGANTVTNATEGAAPAAGAAGAGGWLFTIGEGRRRALLLRLERGEIGPDEPVSYVVDLANDTQEISLDENVTRDDLHPADQFEAFSGQAERLGRSAEEIAARFGVSPLVVRRRLKLAWVSPTLLALYREGELDLDEATFQPHLPCPRKPHKASQCSQACLGAGMWLLSGEKSRFRCDRRGTLYR